MVEGNSDRQAPSRRSVLAAMGVGSTLGLGGLGVGQASGDQGTSTDREDCPGSLTEVAEFPDRLVTGVAVSGDERVFVNFPRFPWAVPVDVSVAEVADDGSISPYPNGDWNAGDWNSDAEEWNGSPEEEFVAVQSVHIEPEEPGTLWVLDTGNPEFETIVEGGPKLVRIDLETDSVEQVHYFGSEITPEQPGGVAYLNDVRLDLDRGFAYLTESELGALVVVNLDTGEERRIMDDWAEFPSTHADTSGHYDVGPHEDQPRPLLGPTNFDVDGIAITFDNESLYYHSLASRYLYRLDTSVLRDFSLSESEIAARAENLGETDITDGMLTDPNGNVYHTDLDDDAITRWNPRKEAMETVVQDSDRIKWPDSLARGPEGRLYVTTSKLHLAQTDTRTEPFKLFRIDGEY